MIRHLASIAEVVDDFDAAVRFYRHTLGLTVEPKPDGNYANVIVGGVLHFAIWRRSHAAQIIFGDVKATDRVPLGFTVGFEVDSVPESERLLGRSGGTILQASHAEPWGQTTSRFPTPSGAICEFSDSPWARTLRTQVEADPA
jgi:catechol 2,3-dioxygenase-like lactoylglutathione lyase family enzyme